MRPLTTVTSKRCVRRFLASEWAGRKPTGAEAKAAAVQLAAYRLAWARLCGIPDDHVHRVRAAFHYVRTNETVEPASQPA
jgi:DNA helicase II / ATP-dependent DNA helicase PcrA